MDQIKLVQFDKSGARSWRSIVLCALLDYDVDGLTQERCNSIAKALELHLSCTNPLMCWEANMPVLGDYPVIPVTWETDCDKRKFGTAIHGISYQPDMEITDRTAAKWKDLWGHDHMNCCAVPLQHCQIFPKSSQHEGEIWGVCYNSTIWFIFWHC